MVSVGEGNISGTMRNVNDKPKTDSDRKNNVNKTYLEAMKSTDVDETSTVDKDPTEVQWTQVRRPVKRMTSSLRTYKYASRNSTSEAAR